jgi:hypothetical protein
MNDRYLLDADAYIIIGRAGLWHSPGDDAEMDGLHERWPHGNLC